MFEKLNPFNWFGSNKEEQEPYKDPDDNVELIVEAECGCDVRPDEICSGCDECHECCGCDDDEEFL